MARRTMGTRSDRVLEPRESSTGSSTDVARRGPPGRMGGTTGAGTHHTPADDRGTDAGPVDTHADRPVITAVHAAIAGRGRAERRPAEENLGFARRQVAERWELRVVRGGAALALGGFVAGCIDTCWSIQRGDATISLTPLVFGGFLLAGTTAVLLELTRRHRERMEDLWVKATVDALTGALNRRAILEVAEDELARARAARGHVALAIADMDRFKAVNDGFGHDAGDALLVAAVHGLRTLHPGAIVGRLGGDEFLVVLPGVDPPGFQRLRAAARAGLAPSIVVRGQPVRTTLSLGASFTDGASFELSPLLKAADLALYAAKEERKEATPRGAVASAGG